MRFVQRNRVARAALALLVGIAVGAGAYGRSPSAASITVATLVAVSVFALLTIAPDAIAHHRGHTWRWWWNPAPGAGPFWPGTRIPRGRRPPRI